MKHSYCSKKVSLKNIHYKVMIRHVDAHRGVREYNKGPLPPVKFSKKLVNKNAIKPKVGGSSSNFVQKAVTLKQKSEVPPPLDFQSVCIFDSEIRLSVF
jgi:hypothetical protein